MPASVILGTRGSNLAIVPIFRARQPTPRNAVAMAFVSAGGAIATQLLMAVIVPKRATLAESVLREFQSGIRQSTKSAVGPEYVTNAVFANAKPVTQGSTTTVYAIVPRVLALIIAGRMRQSHGETVYAAYANVTMNIRTRSKDAIVRRTQRCQRSTTVTAWTVSGAAVPWVYLRTILSKRYAYAQATVIRTTFHIRHSRRL